MAEIVQFIASKYIKFGDHEITFGKERVVIYSLEQLVDQIYLNQKLFGADYNALLYTIAKKQSTYFVKNHGVPIKKLFNLVVQLSSDVLSAFGAVKIRTVKVDEKRTSMFIAGSSSIAKFYKKKYGFSDTQIDFILCGAYAGALECLSKTQTYCIELECSAQKNIDECKWFAGSPQNILEQVNNYYPESVERVTKLLDLLQKTEGKLW
jgi:hypothetical protein